MQCSACGFDNPDDARFCAECARPMVLPRTQPLGTPAPPPGYAVHTTGFAPAGFPAAPAAPPTVPSALGAASVRLELWLENGFVSFDGEVVELFHPRDHACKRQHVAVISDVRFTSGRGSEFLDLRTVYGGMNLLIPFLPHQRKDAERLVAAIQQARARRR